MWALRRVARPARGISPRVFSCYSCCGNALHTDAFEEGVCYYAKALQGSQNCCALTGSSFKHSFQWQRNISFQAGASSNDEDDDLEDGFSDLDEPAESEIIGDIADNNDDVDFVSEAKSSDEGLIEDADVAGKRKADFPPILNIVFYYSGESMVSELNKWVKEGNTLQRSDVALVHMHLRKRRLYLKALEFVNWLEVSKIIELEERDYAYHLDLIFKSSGLQRAEKYIRSIPEAFHTEFVYRTFLADCVAAGNFAKAKQVFKKMQELGFPLTEFACNQLLLLYRQTDKRKISDILLMMEKEGVKFSIFTYKILVDAKGGARDISGMEQVVETMKADGLEPDLLMQSLIVKYYILAGEKDKARAALKKMEGDDVSKNRVACKSLLPLYASLGSVEDVSRIWDICKLDPWLDEVLAAIGAWGKLGNVGKAEEVFECSTKKSKKVSACCYHELLNVYANHKLLDKGKELVKRMDENGCRSGPMMWDAIVNLYTQSGEVEKADAILQRVVENRRVRPLYSTFLMLLNHYAWKGDVNNAEKIFERIRRSGYSRRMKQYQLLLKAYLKAKLPAHGIRDRMRADNIPVNRFMSSQVAAVETLRDKVQISELLDSPV